MEDIKTTSYTSSNKWTFSSLWRQYNWLIIVVAASVCSFVLLLIMGYEVIPQGSTKNAGTTQLIPAVILYLLGILLIRILPPVLAPNDPLAEKGHTQVVKELRLILGYALLYPFLIAAVTLLQLDYIEIGKLLLLLIPCCILFWLFGRKIRYSQGIPRLWYWLGPAIVAVCYLVLNNIPPFSVQGVSTKVTLPTAILFTIITALNAGIPEELFYRVLLQTRLESVLGRWNGIALASLLFALFHLPTRFVSWLAITGSPTSSFILGLAAVLTFQGAGGFLLGYLWSRYRNIWLNMLFHTAIDSLLFLLLALASAH